MPYFDFHLHTTLKGLFSHESNKTNPWEKIDLKTIPWILLWCGDFQYILGSQSNMSQLIDNKCNFVCIALYAPERAVTKDRFLNSQAKGTLSRYLDPKQLEIINSNGSNPYQIVKDDILQVLLNPTRFKIQDRNVIVLKKGVTYQENDPDNLYIVFTVEGCHSLTSSYEKTQLTAQEILDNLNDLTEHMSLPVISVNLTHMEQYPFCNHAYGILFMNNDDFMPMGKEISEEGVKVIQECYQKKILIDLKHMSLGARQYLIGEVRSRPEFAAINQPLVCTHAGFAGIALADIPDYLQYQDLQDKNSGHILWNKPIGYNSVTRTSFNPSSINLYDEEIAAILQSDGLIGLSLDKRILGYTEPLNRPESLLELSYEEEYISKEEKSYFLTKNKTGQKMQEYYCITNQEILEGGTVNPDAAFYHLCHFMSHILHLIKVAQDMSIDVNRALKQVCIGSDFDGLINPVWCCQTVEHLDNFKEQFITKFPGFAKANKDKVKLPARFNIKLIANQLFFENGKNFVMKRLEMLYS